MNLQRFGIFVSLGFTALFSISLARAEFRDVDSEYPYREAIDASVEKGILTGYDDGRFFRPQNSINRAEFIAIVVRSRFSEAEIEECIQSYYDRNYRYVFFPDVPTASWYGRYVCLAKQKKMVEGYSDGTFQPDEPVTFAEAAKIIIRSYELLIRSGLPWYEPYVRILEQENAIPPTIDTFHSLLKRGEVAEIFYRLGEQITDKTSKTYEDLAAFEVHPCDNCLVIEKLDITVPIVFDVGLDALIQKDWKRLEQELLVGLRDGVVHYPGTALPGNRGNVFITGHSSYYTNDPGQYKYVFVGLTKLNVGDLYEIYYQGKKYVYQIFEEKIVQPEDVSVLTQPGDRQIGSLMTCDPPGTNLRRKIFVANRIE